MTTRLERKLARAIVATVGDIGLCPKDNLQRFLLLKRRLERLVGQFKALTGRDTLGEELTQIVAYASGTP